jgi:hypothetical protein
MSMSGYFVRHVELMPAIKYTEIRPPCGRWTFYYIGILICVERPGPIFLNNLIV